MVSKKKNQQVNCVNIQKLNGLQKSFSFLPKNSFSKIIVVFCLISIVAIITASYVLLVLGYDTSSLITPSLCALSGELLILGAKRILAKSEAIQDTVLEEIKEDLNDGKIYDSFGNIVGYENSFSTMTSSSSNNSTNNSTNTTSGDTYIDNSVTNNYSNKNDNEDEIQDENEDEIQEEDIELEQEQEVKPVFDASSIEVPSVQTQTTVKKRGRPKKVVKKEEPKQEDDNTLEDSAGWLDEDMSD